ncbi:hypothetical protein [Vibrio toranzoniae]|uniref:hypothetical protein n=1 Tax=Vibrio toranzoniae TaxID=1194427 RepID=UPI001377245E|nr:hypothetical protein [Vibrio toranzoniae]NAZ96009.1 hypothetical protein [Vibrio toranzoniae]
MISPLLLRYIRRINRKHIPLANSCQEVVPFLSVYFSNELLAKTKVVYVKEVPKLLPSGLLFGKAAGIALEDTVYVKEEYRYRWHLHFHELVHIQQWQRLGSIEFLSQYIVEALTRGYRCNNFEVEAFELEERFKRNDVFRIC